MIVARRNSAAGLARQDPHHPARAGSAEGVVLKTALLVLISEQ
ncbi:MAG: hypothetical protein P4L42_09570 [Desulfocapsaceae bacterium]|nr:hypothetical protein [Desulfocapsaceae bacterium]